MKRLISDLKFAAHSLSRSPGVTLVIVLTLSLAIGATTTVFSVLHGVLLKDLPFDDPERVVQLRSVMTTQGDRTTGLSPADFFDFARDQQTFSHLGGFQYTGKTIGLGARPRDVPGIFVTADFFRALGVEPQLGRLLADVGEGTPEALISHGIWQQQFGGRPSIIGETIHLDGEPHVVVGVMPPSLQYPSSRSGFYLLRADEYDPDSRTARYFPTIGRLKQGVSIAQANADVRAIAERLAQTYPESNTGWSARVDPLKDQIVGDYQQSLWILMVVVLFVMLIACANVANMLLARGEQRARELAIRVALGADRRRIVRLLMVEALALALASGGFGLLLTFAAMDAVSYLSSLGLPRLNEIGVDPVVAGFAVGLAVFSTLLFGMIPALKSSQLNVMDALKTGGKGVSSAGAGRVQKAFSIVSIALSLVLLVVSGLLGQSFLALQNVELGFQPANTAAVQLWRTTDPAERLSFWNQVVQILDDDPTIESAGVGNYLPMDFITGGRTEVAVPGRSADEPVLAGVIRVFGDYFETMGIETVRGESLDASFNFNEEPVVWINESLARTYFADSDPLGRQLALLDATYRIVGVVGDVKQSSLEEASNPTVYFPLALVDWGMGNVVARGAMTPAALTEKILDAIYAVDPAQSVYRDMLPSQLLDSELADDRVYLQLVLAFTGVALVLACVGIYSVIAYSVGQRRSELGLRAALGAPRGRLVTLILKEGIVKVVAGLAIGLGLSLLLTRWLANLLYTVSAVNAVALLSACVVLALVAMFASWLPAHRASRVDPAVALHAE